MELRWIVDAPNPQDHSLPVHQAGYRMIRADPSGIGDGSCGSGEISHGEFPGARLGNDLFVGSPELSEIEFLASLDVGNEELASAI